MKKVKKFRWAEMEFALSIPKFLRDGKHRRDMSYLKAVVVDPDLNVTVSHTAGSLGKLIDYPYNYGRSSRWCQYGSNKSFRKNDFIDGPYSLSYKEA